MDRPGPLVATSEIVAERYGDAAVVFLAGSIMRGEDTDTSDLDLVVVNERIDAAFRESFRYAGWPVEAFVHDPEALRFFFLHVDRPAGCPHLLIWWRRVRRCHAPRSSRGRCSRSPVRSSYEGRRGGPRSEFASPAMESQSRR